ncbi:unnamed protein product [Ectocarpus sp. 6 AP-2014]
MWGKVLILPLCTVIVAIFSAPFASGQCSCGGAGPSADSMSGDGINSLVCGPTDAETDCNGLACICDYHVTVAPTHDLNSDPPQLRLFWYCTGNDGYCTTCTPATEEQVCTDPEKPKCCSETGICTIEDDGGACGDPHMTGFLGQKFDFVGRDSEWYAVVSDMPGLEVNMRVTSPVPAEPEITYITGLGIKTVDNEGLDHSIVITVTDPHSLDSACPVEGSTCLADGALTVELDGEVALLSPGEVELGPNVAISAVNLPGACRSFGFEEYWERKKAEYATSGRRLNNLSQMQEMSDWILGDPTATNMAECTEYVLGATVDGQAGLLEHDSEHTSFQILTPKGSIRLTHGRLHQLAMRDPTDRFDIPDHLTWQMNLAFDNIDLAPDATGILGETQQYTYDANGNPIMEGMAAIRGSQEDYLVEGPLDTVFAAARNHP